MLQQSLSGVLKVSERTSVVIRSSGEEVLKFSVDSPVGGTDTVRSIVALAGRTSEPPQHLKRHDVSDEAEK